MTRPRAADDFAAIRARIEELRRQRAQAARDDPVEPSDQAHPRGRSAVAIDEKALLQRAIGRNRFSR